MCVHVFRMVLQQAPSSIESLVKAALVLHNFLRKNSSRNEHCPQGLLDTESMSGEVTNGLWRQESISESFLPLSVPVTGHNATNDAKLIRDTFIDYFATKGVYGNDFNMLEKESMAFRFEQIAV